MIYNDIDRLQVAIKHGIEKLIKSDIKNMVNQTGIKINNVIEDAGASGNMEIKQTEKGTKIQGTINVPANNAPEFIVNIDNSIKGSFRFSKWSDMKVN